MTTIWVMLSKYGVYDEIKLKYRKQRPAKVLQRGSTFWQLTWQKWKQSASWLSHGDLFVTNRDMWASFTVNPLTALIQIVTYNCKNAMTTYITIKHIITESSRINCDKTQQIADVQVNCYNLI